MNLKDISTEDLWTLVRSAEKVESEMLQLGIDGWFAVFDEEIEAYDGVVDAIKFHLLCRGENVYGNH